MEENGPREGSHSVIQDNLWIADASSILTFTVVFLVISKLYWNVGKKDKGKSENPEWEHLPGLEAIPGPRSWDPTGILGNTLDFLPFEKSITNGLKFMTNYGSVYKLIGLNQTWVVLNSGPTIQALCKSIDMGHLTKSPEIYELMKPFITNGVLVSKGKFWQHERKILLKSQSYQSLKAYMPMLNKHCKSFVSSLGEMFRDGKPHQINELINSSFLKVISEMITGFDNDESDECSQYHHNFQIWKEAFIARFLKPWLLLPPIWKLHPISRKHGQAVEEMFGFARRRVHEHRVKRAKLQEQVTMENHPDPEITSIKAPTFRSVLDELVDGGVEEDQIIDEINTMLFGGHETGATAIHFFCFCMALHPEIQRECQKEIDELFDDPLNFKNDVITYESISGNLKFVERCISETLRLFPPIFMFSRKLLSPLKINHNGQDIVIPAGSNACIAPMLVHMNPEYYPAPETYNPDRFLPEENAKRHPYAYVPFSAGSRNCLGLKFAMIEMKTIAAYTLRHFSITTTDKMGDIPLLPYLTTTPAKDYTFQFSKRNISSNS